MLIIQALLRIIAGITSIVLGIIQLYRLLADG